MYNERIISQGNAANTDSPIGTQLCGFIECFKTIITVRFIWALSPFKGVKANLKVKLALPLFHM